MNVAEMLVEELADSGVKRIYGLIGDSLNPIGDAVHHSKRIKWLSVRHEESAAIAAGAEAELSGELCVCAATNGPGSVHLINGLYEANRNHSPVLAIVTHMDTGEQGLSFFQATHPELIYRDCSIFCEAMVSPKQMPRLLQEAMQTAVSGKGVAVIILPRDVSESNIEESVYQHPVRKTDHLIQPQEEDVKKLANLINSYNKVTLYCGIGCKNAKSEVLALADRIKAPTVCTLRSKEFMEADNPYNAGLNGKISSWESKEALDNCDLLLLLGTDFPFENYIPTHAAVAQIDIVGKHLGRRSRLDLGIVGGVRETLEMLLPYVREKEDDAHLKASLSYKAAIDEGKKAELDKFKQDEVLRPEYLTSVLSGVAADDAVFTVDVGLNDIWAARYLQAMPHRNIIGSFKHATMAAALPTAIGAQLSDKARQVIVMAGDGGLTMLMGELLTLVQSNLPIKVVVYNNGELGFIRYEAELEKMEPFQVELKNPDFAAMAETIGIKGVKIEHPDGLEEVLKQALLEKGPVLINAVTDPKAIGYCNYCRVKQ